jgi:carbon-monoxide dehydrogenase large subunit
MMQAETLSTACTHNPLGVKGCGELGTIGAPATVINAVVDALGDLGVSHVDMPASSSRIWEIVNNAHMAKASLGA